MFKLHRIFATRFQHNTAWFRFALCLGLLICAPAISHASDTNAAPGEPKLIMEVFWGETCGYCKAQKPFLKELAERYPRLNIRQYEVYRSQLNRDIFARTAGAHGVQASGVPAVFVDGQYFSGDSPSIRTRIEDTVRQALDRKVAAVAATAATHTEQSPSATTEAAPAAVPK